MENYLAIGDIHGRMDLLSRILKRADTEYPKHRLLFLGDYIDRGPDACDVLETVKQRVEKGAVAVLGNHEDFMLSYVKGKYQNSSHPWLIPGNGGKKTIESYQKHGREYSMKAIMTVPRRMGHISFLESLPYFYETETIFASHAPLHKENMMGTKDKEGLIWSYFEDEENAKDWGKLSICGHIHALSRDILEPRVFKHIVYADTGCGCASWGPLSAIIIEYGEYKGFFQAVPNAS